MPHSAANDSKPPMSSSLVQGFHRTSQLCLGPSNSALILPRLRRLLRLTPPMHTAAKAHFAGTDHGARLLLLRAAETAVLLRLPRSSVCRASALLALPPSPGLTLSSAAAATAAAAAAVHHHSRCHLRPSPSCAASPTSMSESVPSSSPERNRSGVALRAVELPFPVSSPRCQACQSSAASAACAQVTMESEKAASLPELSAAAAPCAAAPAIQHVVNRQTNNVRRAVAALRIVLSSVLVAPLP